MAARAFRGGTTPGRARQGRGTRRGPRVVARMESGLAEETAARGPATADPAEGDLLAQAKRGNLFAFEEIVRRYQRRAYGVALRIVRRHDVADDVAQETFLSAWRDLPQLKDKQKFGRWLNQIAISSSKLWLRDQRKYQGKTVPFEEGVVPQAQELRDQRENLRQWVWDAIDVLTEDRREVVILY